MLAYLGLVAAGLSGVASVPGVVLPLSHDAADRPVAPAPSSPGAAPADAAGRGPDSPVQVTVPHAAPAAGAPQPVNTPGVASGAAPAASGAAPAAFAPASATPQATASPHGQGQGLGSATGKPTSKPTPARR
jgi:hypothetical protein